MTLRTVWEFFFPQTNGKTTWSEFPVFLVQSDEEDLNIRFGVSWCIPAEKENLCQCFSNWVPRNPGVSETLLKVWAFSTLVIIFRAD